MIVIINACKSKSSFQPSPWSLFHSSPEQTHGTLYTTEAFSKVCPLLWCIISNTLLYLTVQLPHFFTQLFCIKTRMSLLLLLRIVGGGVQTGSTRHRGHLLSYCACPGDCEDGELFGGMKIGRGNRSTRRKPAPAPLCPPQIPMF
jgi:hypothetical protein